MRRFLCRAIVFFAIIFLQVFSPLSAATFTSAKTGNWNDGATWGSANSPGTVGIDYPGAGDDAIVSGHAITVVGSSACRNLLVGAATSNSITISVFFSSLTINGTLLGYNGAPAPPVQPSSINGGLLVFTGSDINGFAPSITTEVIAAWNSNNQINANVSFSFGSNNRSIDLITFDGFNPSNMDFGGNVTVSSGTLSNGNLLISDIRLTSATASLSVSNGAALDLSIPLTIDGTNQINQLTNDGTITTSSYINSNTCNLGANSTLNTSYNGTEGWWSGTNRPTSFSIDNTSTVNYNSSSAQNIYATQYGHLQLNSSNKDLSSTGILQVNGNLTIGTSVTLNSNTNSNSVSIKGNLVNNSGTWAPNQTVVFDGTGSQAISGSGVSFNGGITFGNGIDANSVSIVQDLATTNLLIQPSSEFSPGSNGITLSGDWTNNGTFTQGTSSITFNGSSVLSGTSSTAFNTSSITGTADVNSANIALGDLNVSAAGVLNTNNTTSVDDLVNAGTVNCNASTLNVGGSFTNNNTFNRGTGTVNFNGTGVQDVSGSGSIAFHNLTITNTTPATDVVNLNADINLYNVLTLNSNSHIDADGSSDAGSLTLISGSTGTAKIAPIGSGAVLDGNVTTQRFVAAGTTGWRFISTPIKNQTLASWSDDFSIQGVTGGSPADGDPIVFTYNEPSGTGPNNGVDGWSAFTNITDNISNAGIRVYFFESQLSGGLVIDNTGPPIVGDGGNNTVLGTEKYTVSVDFTPGGFDGGGWNLVENPYPCEIDYENVISSSGKDAGLVNVDNGIYIWNPTVGASGNYGSYVGGVSTNSVTQYIASGQSFFVKANNTGASISFIENDKVTNQGNTFIRKEAVDNVLKVKIASGDRVNFDEAAIRFRNGSSEAFEREFDAYKLANGWINISSITDEALDLSINTLGNSKGVHAVKLRIAAWTFGDFKINFSGLESFTEKVQFRLVDKYLDKSMVVNPESEYSFEIVKNIPETYGDDRFELILSPIVSFRSEQISAKAGKEFLIPIYADQLIEVLSTTLTMGWDKELLEFVAIEEPGTGEAGDFDLSKVEEGELVYTNINEAPLNLPDSTKLFAIRFKALNGQPQVVLSFVDESINIKSVDDIEMPFDSENAMISILQNKFVSGEISTYNGFGVEGVKVSTKGEEPIENFSEVGGLYALDTYENESYVISAQKTDDPRLNTGVTTLDIIKARRHLLKIQELNIPYQIVAADVNMSKSVTALDLALMRLVVLGAEKGFKDGINWLFIPEIYDLTEDPFDFATDFEVHLTDQNVDLDFVAVKIGDVNNSWKSTTSGRIANRKVELKLENPGVENAVIEIPVTAGDFKDISGYQFTVSWDPAQLEYYGVEHGELEGFYNEQIVDNGVLTTVWDEPGGGSIALEKGAVLFKLRFTAKTGDAKSLVEIGSDLTEAVAFDGKLNAMGINASAVNIDLEELRKGRLELGQNAPNPFKSETTIEFKIVKPGKARFTVMNTLGEIVYMHEEDYAPGIYKLRWDKGQGMRPVNKGVYLYRLESNGEEVVRRMLVE
ncbi:MAG: T9SS type A sorting domain-containing protein [Cytophagales bacterium]|nr:T9SS type A sorting domain-containing protein [Cytophagales bacterium]